MSERLLPDDLAGRVVDVLDEILTEEEANDDWTSELCVLLWRRLTGREDYPDDVDFTPAVVDVRVRDGLL